MSAVAETDHRSVVRPLRVIEAELIEEFKMADNAAADAARPYYERAAPLLAEAKEGHFHNDTAGFYAWAQKKFGKSKDTIRTWTQLGSSTRSKQFKNLEHFRTTPKEHGGLGVNYKATALRREWTAPVDAIAERAQREAFRLAQEDALTRAEERVANRKLAHRLIDIGYKVLAKELHPDKLHGDRTAMQRLNAVRDMLKHSI
jgi:hypothetical protein